MKARTFLFLLIAFTCIVKSNAQVPNWVWAKSAGGTNDDLAYSVVTDASGNVFVAGYFRSSSIVFGFDTLINTSGNPYIFLAKYDASGNILWAKAGIGTSGWDEAYSVITDASGNVYIAGFFDSNTITFDSIVLMNSGGGGNIFLAKYDATGNVLWAKTPAGKYNDYAYSVATDTWGNVYLAGDFESDSLTFGSETLLNPSPGNSDIFIVKYDSIGNVLWAKRFGGYNYDWASSITTDASGNLLVVGNFVSDTISFDSMTLTNAGGNCGSYPNPPCSDIFIAKFDSNGIVLWAKRAGGTNSDYATSVTTTASGYVIVAGNFESSFISFGVTSIPNVDTSGNSSDMFLAKYDPSGNLFWAKRAGGTWDDRLNSITIDNEGNAYVTGDFSSDTINFGSTILLNTNIFGNQIFLAKYNPFGITLWAKSAGNDGGNYATSVATNPSGNIHIVGYFGSSSINFNSTVLTNSNSGYGDIFLAKLNVETGITESSENQKNIFIYPNPTTGIFQISGIQYPESNVEIYNVLGKMICQSEISYLKSEIDLSKYPPGIYFIKLFTAEKTYTEKLIKQ